jgi:hypothetical protein
MPKFHSGIAGANTSGAARSVTAGRARAAVRELRCVGKRALDDCDRCG